MTPLCLISAAGALFVGASLLAQQKPASAETTTVTVDKMVAANKSRKEVAQYVFDNHGCKNCHTAGEGGKLGFTERGKQLTNGFEGCIRMLTAMNVIAQLPAKQRSAEEQTKAERFEKFGCTLCHKIIPGKMGFTRLGAKLRYLHLGCVDIERVVAAQ